MSPSTLWHRLASLLRPPSASGAAAPEASPYRDEPDDRLAALADLEALVAGQARRIRVLEQQLAAAGQEPVPTPSGRDLLEVAEILDNLAHARGSARWNTIELGALAKLVRGLARHS